MNPTTATIINLVLTALPGIYAAWQAAGGKFDTSGAIAAGGAVVGALNTLFHAYSTAQSGPMVTK